MDAVKKAAIEGMVRDGFKVLGVVLVVLGVIKVGGVINPSDWQQILDGVQLIVGTLLTVVPIIYGAIAKFRMAHVAVIAGANAQAVGALPANPTSAETRSAIANFSPPTTSVSKP